ncbi:MAG: hypothetical protein F6K47_38070 [Symploca sp. SIO2E6]|nr:hypothetical protein [Symploca sp. SIO2E6]
MPIIKSTSEVDGEQVDIYIEVDQVPEVSDSQKSYRSTTRHKALEKSIKAMGDRFGDGLDLSRKCAAQVVHSVNQMHDTVKPNEFEVQLAIKLSSEVGAVVTKLGGEAQMQVTMKWILKEQPKQP